MKDFGLEFSLNYIDYELYPPTSLDQHRNDFDALESFHQAVPLIRIFGRTDAGQNVCALVHGVYPYMYIRYDGEIDDQSIHANCLRLHQNVNIVLATTYRRNPHDDGSTFVADICVCKATSFYGLSAGWSFYYKVSLLSPKHMTRLADLFRSGQILGKAFQPYESHVPYLLQFMIDYNLYGCGAVRCSSVCFRQPLPPKSAKVLDTGSSEDNSYRSTRSLHGHNELHIENVPEHRVLEEAQYPRRSHSTLEVDLSAGAIRNRDKLRQRAIHHDITTEAQNIPADTERLLPSLTELWEDDARRREALGLTPCKSQLPQSNVRQRSNVWSNESDLRSSLDKVLAEQKAVLTQVPDDKVDWQAVNNLPTSFESIQLFCDRQAAIIDSNSTKEMSFAMDGLRRAPLLSRHTAQIRAFNQQGLKSDSVTSPISSKGDLSRPQLVSASAGDIRYEIHLSDAIKSQLPTILRLRGGFDAASLRRYAVIPPTTGSLLPRRLEAVQSAFPEPFYSDPADVPILARDYAANGFMPKSYTAAHLHPFEGVQDSMLHSRNSRFLQFSIPPPSRHLLRKSDMDAVSQRKKQTTQIAMPTQALPAERQPRKISEADVPLSVLSIEVHAQSRGSLLPDPVEDPLIAVFWTFQDFALDAPRNSGCMISTQTITTFETMSRTPDTNIKFFDTEIDLIQEVIDLVRMLDPDAVLSFEMQNSSIGFIEERTKKIFGFSFEGEISRIVNPEKDEPGYVDRWGETHATSVKISGRHVLNLWRIMRSEMNLLQYTLENVCFHLLRLRIPKYNHADLQKWLMSGKAAAQQRMIRYYIHRTDLNLEIIEAQGLLSRVSEQARLLGIDFYSVFSRGSQFKVESLMCRIAKPECYMMLSPSKKQVAQQNALECLPLVMEPQSRFYNDPILVLDFQSLYPSIVIAYNFCYSTCLGKLGYGGLERKLGVSHYDPDPSTMQQLKDDIEIAPNGVLYVRDHRRKSLLAKMLHDLLETRAMVKEGMKLCKNDRAAQKLMHNRQLALKLIANVTYGYTSASFSGRMPCSDIADSIVQTGRETLEKAIEFIHSHESWNAEVVYGDTDSLFVKLPGRSKREAFDIGSQMAQEITRMSPSPIKLKFEKVYLPCVLLAKKRYVGFKYESPLDVEPVFDAKGIETVRRDGTPAEQKIEEQALKIMFRTGNLSAVKDFFQEECWKIMTGRCSLHDFCFAKEVKLGSYSTKGLPPPGAVISAKSIAADPRSEPQYGERVSYLVISGPTRSRLTDRCVPPEELLLNPELRLDVEYYITKNLVPPLDRIFTLMGVNVRSWYDEMPRSLKLIQRMSIPEKPKSSRMIETFLSSSHCPVCQQEQPKAGICADCLSRPADTVFDIVHESRSREQTNQRILKVCASCCNVPMYSEIACVSKDCPIYYKRIKSGREVDINALSNALPLFAPLS